ncbi:hypothetical protein GCM10020331_000880 [Ectobacillus funiculus]
MEKNAVYYFFTRIAQLERDLTSERTKEGFWLQGNEESFLKGRKTDEEKKLIMPYIL